jgi:hypothetical protein
MIKQYIDSAVAVNGACGQPVSTSMRYGSNLSLRVATAVDRGMSVLLQAPHTSELLSSSPPVCLLVTAILARCPSFRASGDFGGC